jgi:hypothetical protein
MHVPVSLDFSKIRNGVDPLPILRQAIAYKKVPEGWRPAEYVMTKMSAMEALAVFEVAKSTVSLDLFDWGILTGEIARLYIAGGRKNDSIIDLYMSINAAIEANPLARKIQLESEKLQKAQRMLEKLEARRERAVRRLQQLDLTQKERVRRQYERARPQVAELL